MLSQAARTQLARSATGLLAIGAMAAGIGAAGMTLFAFAPEPISAGAALVISSGIAVPLTRIVSAIWVNARTTSGVRATTHSYLAQAEYLGEVTCGLAIALIANLLGLPLALACCADLIDYQSRAADAFVRRRVCRV